MVQSFEDLRLARRSWLRNPYDAATAAQNTTIISSMLFYYYAKIHWRGRN